MNAQICALREALNGRHISSLAEFDYLAQSRYDLAAINLRLVLTISLLERQVGQLQQQVQHLQQQLQQLLPLGHEAGALRVVVSYGLGISRLS